MAIDDELKAQILRYHFVEHWRVGTIASQLGIHHSTVERVLGEAGVERERRRPRRPSKLDPYMGFIAETLERFPTLTAARLFDMVKARGQPRGQTVGQQAEGGVALGAIPASDACPARGLARVGAVACQRTSSVRMIRTPLKACIAPRLGFDVLLAGMPRRVSKLHRLWPGRAVPAKARSSLPKGRRDYDTTTTAPNRIEVRADEPVGADLFLIG